MINKLKLFFQKNKIRLSEKRLCVCLSGGADSVALLFAMVDLQKEEKFFLSAVHVNHNIRGDEAHRDEEFCRLLCQRLGVELYAFSVFALEEAKRTGEGVEETARKLRYLAFKTVEKQENINYFLTAHHLNDSCETIIFNILRGCGVSGITGIPAVRDTYLRPFIDCRRSEILSYLQRKGEAYVEDSTNSNVDYTRNYIRHKLMPMFERVNPSYLSAILRLSQNAQQDEDYFSNELDKIRDDDDLSLLHPAIASRVIGKRFSDIVKGEGLSMVHIRQIMECLKSSEEKSIDVPFGLSAIVKNGRVAFKEKTVKKVFEKELEKGENILECGFSVLVENKYIKNIKFSDNPLQITLDCDKIKGKLFARNRKEGDKIICRGFSRSVCKELINSKVPKHIRDILPIICDNEGIVFVPYVGANDRVFKKGVVENPLALTIQQAGKETINER